MMTLFQLGLLFFLIQVAEGVSKETRPCEPGFSSESYVFTVTRMTLERGRVLGKVHFDDCSGRMQAPYDAGDSRVRVLPNGRLVVKRPMRLHEGQHSFPIYAWASSGKKFSAKVVIQNRQDSSPVGQGEMPVMTQPESRPGPRRQN
ncbi:cadherin-1 [Microcaecilia unicolor]|uniref:Cadherin-1-like n=1 Tax=Microcaecilia unicolor TaxID=1415580 RepID=A0A6P7Y1A7_9AMPH|nr:cadherin-1-like [Microcaecilia unicolor]